MGDEEMTMSAREAIRIAEKYIPHDMGRQKELAMDIIDAINLSEREFAHEIILRVRRGLA